MTRCWFLRDGECILAPKDDAGKRCLGRCWCYATFEAQGRRVLALVKEVRP